MSVSHYEAPAGLARRSLATGSSTSGKPARRSQRVTLRMRILAFASKALGQSADFEEQTYVVRVSAHGGMIELEHGLERGAIFKLRHSKSEEEADCRIVSISKSQSGKRYAGFEFVDGKLDFWRISFPPPGARPILEKA